MGTFVITRQPNGEYRFVLKAGNGEIILASETYATKIAVENGIASVVSNSPRKERYESKSTSNGKYYFNLKASNGQVIGASGMYQSESSRDNGIQSVMRNAVGAQIEDSTVTDELLSVTTSQFVRERRRQIGLTQEELAFKAGVGLRFIRELERGDKDTLRIDKVNQVLKLFGYILGPVQINRS
nr:DUF1508 domain-containing protein [Chitinophaga varians]